MRASYVQRYSVALALATAALFAPSALAQPVIYVDADASGADDGSSWANAFEELDDALAAAGSSAQIWVAEGVYRPTDGADRTRSFGLKSGVALLGGFVGSETSAGQRNPDPATNNTVLSGDIGVQGTSNDNSYHVLTAEGVDETAVLDGFTITGGRADADRPHDRGGGLSNYDGTQAKADGEGYPTLRNLTFASNSATYGGGLYLNGAAGTVTFQDVSFVRNSGALQGGGMYVGADLEMERVAFVNNAASEFGGGAWFSGGESILRDVVFDSNVAIGPEGGGALGGGLHVRASTRLIVVDAVFVRNRGSNSSGGGAGVAVMQNAEVDIVNATFAGNSGYVLAALLTTQQSTVRVTNATFVGNRPVNPTTKTIAGATWDSKLTLTNVTVAGNDGGLGAYSTEPLVVNNLIYWGNSGADFSGYLFEATEVDHAIVEGGYSGGESILAEDPLFVRQPDPGADGVWGTDDDDDGDLRLRTGSPALDFGDDDLLPQDPADLDGDGVTGERLPFDFNGNARIQGGRVDLGAYEGAIVVVSAESGARAGEGLSLSASAPNPAHGLARITLNVETAESVEVGVYDLLGRQLVALHNGPLAAGERAFEIDGAAFPAGVYVVRASSAQGTATRHITVVR